MFTDIETIVFSMFFLFFAVWAFFTSPLYIAVQKINILCAAYVYQPVHGI